jgi:hypothetical protein
MLEQIERDQVRRIGRIHANGDAPLQRSKVDAIVS